MKSLHRPDLFAWSRFDETRNIDFNSVFVERAQFGNVVIDPLPVTPHDRAHIEKLGGVAIIVVTNSDHTRAAVELAAWTGARVLAPRAEQPFPIPVDRFVGDGDDVAPGLRVFELFGSKTPGELVVLIEGHTLVFGDLVRAHKADSLHFLPPDKLSNATVAKASVQRLLEHTGVRAVLVGDGWSIFCDGHARLAELVGPGRAT